MTAPDPPKVTITLPAGAPADLLKLLDAHPEMVDPRWRVGTRCALLAAVILKKY